MKRHVLFGLVATVLSIGIALTAMAQVPGSIRISSLVGSFSLNINHGPTSSQLPLNGGTFTCGSSTATITNTNVDAGSLILFTLKTVGGTVAAPFVATITPGTGATITCGGSDTSTYNYVIIG
jgi:hypothetical protein